MTPEITKSLNTNLQIAKREKNDEFYTPLADIERELRSYKHHFQDKVVYCNCDDYKHSHFFNYFALNFVHLGLKKLIATCYQQQAINNKPAVKVEYYGEMIANVPNLDSLQITPLQEDGDFRSQECVELLKQADIVVTNPPFSLFREFIALLVSHDKKFLIVGNKNAITYKEIFPLVKANHLWLGNNSIKRFKIPSNSELIEGRQNIICEDGDYYAVFGNIGWFTNLDFKKRHDDILLFKQYHQDRYPFYDNYDAIEVSKVSEIPYDYLGVMGVPITFLDKYNPDQFDIVGMGEDNGRGQAGSIWRGGSLKCLINGKAKFKRIFIKQKL